MAFPWPVARHDERQRRSEAAAPSGPPRKWLRRVAFLVTWLGLALSSYCLYLYSTEPLHVYPHVPETATDFLVGTLSLALFYLLAHWVTRRVWFPILLVVPITVYIVLIMPDWKRAGFRIDRVSRANHSGQWSLRFWAYMDSEVARDPQARFPDGTTIDKLISAVIKAGHLDPYTRLPLEEEEGQRGAWYCPGRARSTEPGTGYVYVGGGLSIKLATEKEALIALDAAGCHPPPEDHEHAFVADPPGIFRRCCDGARIQSLIERALAQAAAGEVPYSPEAVRLLQREIQARRALLKRGKLNPPRCPPVP